MYSEILLLKAILNMNKIAVFLGIVLVLLSALFVYFYMTTPAQPLTPEYVGETFVFTGIAGEELAVQYDESADYALVTFAGTQYELLRVATGSGARYESGNGQVVFTEHQGEARLVVGEEIMIVATEQVVVQSEESTIDTSVDFRTVVVEMQDMVEVIEVVDVPVLGQRCVDSVTVDCAALEAASGY